MSLRGERIELKCACCGKHFLLRPCDVKRGAKYCGRGCYYAGSFGTPREKYGDDNVVEIKTCIACGKEFETGGHGRQHKTNKMCSDKCQRATRYIYERKRGAVNTMSLSEAAWLAGFMDGEGCVMLNGRKDTFGLRITASNTHRKTLERILKITGNGSIVWYNRNSTKNKDSGWWIAHGQVAEDVLIQIIPFMVTKERQAWIGINFQSRLRLPHLKADRSWQRELHLQLKALNRRGPITHDIVIS